MINFIKKIFSIFEEHPDKKINTQDWQAKEICKCCFCQPIKSIRPPSPSQLKRDVKKCKRNINVGLKSTQEDLKELINFMEDKRNYLGNQTVEFVKIANKARNQKKQ